MSLEINSYSEYAQLVGKVEFTGKIHKGKICSVCHKQKILTEQTKCFIPEYGKECYFEEYVCPECKSKILSNEFDLHVVNY